jgi:hypothetical protein
MAGNKIAMTANKPFHRTRYRALARATRAGERRR